jgi:serine-type D-Ala-D-Ala carboxypeptidase/endopeptidase (penicillin-binding protein 4)
METRPSSRLPRLAFAVLLLGLGLAIGGRAAPARAEGARAETTAEARPDPGLQAAVDELAVWVKAQGGQLGAALLDVGSGRLLARSGHELPLNPASNAKIPTAAAALDRLGPTYRYTTGLYGRLQGGRVEELVLRGHGDPSFGLDDLWAMARALVNLGLKQVDGIRVDQSRFDDEFVPPAFEQQPNEWAAFRAPVSAVALERNTVTLNVVAQSAGEPARVWFDPPGFVDVRGGVRTAARGKGQNVLLTLRPKGDRLEAVVGGHVASGLPRLRFVRRADDPRLMAGYVLRYVLGELGVKVTGGVRDGGSAQKSRLVFQRSEPISALVSRLGKQSDNFYAETILKTLGAESGGEPATSASGAAAVEAWMRETDAWTPGTRVTNGSGLFDANRISADSLTRVLRAGYRDPSIRPEFVAQLAVGGLDGTLRSRFKRHGKTRVVRAKTGTLARVVALSGYVLAPADRQPVAFSLLVTGMSNHSESRRRIDRVVEQLVASLWKA